MELLLEASGLRLGCVCNSSLSTTKSFSVTSQKTLPTRAASLRQDFAKYSSLSAIFVPQSGSYLKDAARVGRACCELQVSHLPRLRRCHTSRQFNKVQCFAGCTLKHSANYRVRYGWMPYELCSNGNTSTRALTHTMKQMNSKRNNSCSCFNSFFPS